MCVGGTGPKAECDGAEDEGDALNGAEDDCPDGTDEGGSIDFVESV